MTLTEIRLRLAELGVRPSRRFGQNFLHDQNLARRIVELADARPDEPVLEIGPGLGALTEWLIRFGTDLTLIEKDRRLAAFLRGRYPDVKVIEGDALTEISNLTAAKAGQEFQISNWLVLGNLPYPIASPLMIRLCEGDLRPRRMLFTVQREVAERMAALHGCRDYGLLTLLIQPFYEVKILRKIPATVFWPRPDVNSALVALSRRERQPFVRPEEEAAFRGIVKCAFQKRRKTLRAIFGNATPAGAPQDRRPEELSVEEWIAAAPRHPQHEEEMFDVVNAQDEVAGQERRSTVHARDLLHRAVHIFIRNGKGELLLQKRSATKDISPNTWDSSAAGHLGVGEPYDDAARREVLEELGVAPALRRAQKFEARKELGWEFVWLYEGESEGPFRFPESEISELRWWTPVQIEAALTHHPEEFASSFRHIWQALR
ncbi:MAG: ribosomal RNA small subunit methyltransferase A [Verrucomicrobia bacterium]|nr:ribosomal RNA small subunit methyltransferase A [Verrucomicrobiota bacterium]